MITFTIVLLFVIAGILLVGLVIDDEAGFDVKLFQVALMVTFVLWLLVVTQMICVFL